MEHYKTMYEQNTHGEMIVHVDLVYIPNATYTDM